MKSKFCEVNQQLVNVGYLEIYDQYFFFKIFLIVFAEYGHFYTFSVYLLISKDKELKYVNLESIIVHVQNLLVKFAHF